LSIAVAGMLIADVSGIIADVSGSVALIIVLGAKDW
jgi:hypothetical protein